MAPQEFYIRNASDTEARGPFNLEQLSSLAENGQVTPDTVYYDSAAERWVTVGSDNALLQQLFPEKKKLKVRPKDQIQSLNTSTESMPPIEVTDMLAAAEGRSADTKDKADPTEALARAARIGMYACTTTLLISGAALLAPSIDTIVIGDYPKLLTQPFAVLGAVDLLLFLLMLLQAVAIYPFIRFRAALGAGFLGLFFYVQGEPQTALYAVLGSVGIYFSTVFTNLFAVLLMALIGIGSMGAFAWAVLNS